MDHAELIAELPLVEQLPVVKRLELARKRRALQLVKYCERSERDGVVQNGDGTIRVTLNAQRTIRVVFPQSISLLEATFRGDLDEVKVLLDAGCDPNARNEDGLTPLHQCCIDDNEDMLRVFLDRGADVNARDTEQWTPLHAAACCGHQRVAKILVENGADLLAVNADGNMPYDICDDDVTLDFLESQMASRGVTQEQIDFLRGATERDMLADMQQLYASGGSLETADRSGATPLHIASANGYASVVTFLLDCGAKVDPRDKDSWMPIHAAACWAQDQMVTYARDIIMDLRRERDEQQQLKRQQL